MINNDSGAILDRNGNPVDVARIYGESFSEEIDRASFAAGSQSDYSNEVFIYFKIRILEYERALSVGTLKKVIINRRFVDWPLISLAARRAGVLRRIDLIRHAILNAFFFVQGCTIAILQSLILPIYAFIVSPHSVMPTGDFAVIRSPATKAKLAFLIQKGKLHSLYDDIGGIKKAHPSLYGIGSKSERVRGILRVPGLVIRDLVQIASDSRKTVGRGAAGFVLHYYATRIAHKCLFEYYLNIVIASKNTGTCFTGNKEDRFAQLENRLCLKHGRRLVCIPHGIEYSYRVPSGLPGDIFYCTTIEAREVLIKKYGIVNKFVFDQNIAKGMFNRLASGTCTSPVVFFTEARGAEINVRIIKHLVDKNIIVGIKMHPNDSIGNYAGFVDKIEVISDFASAISGRTCLARKSTILVEALYNDSRPIAVLIDPSDRANFMYMFPSLQAKGILKALSFDDLDLLLGIS